MKILFLTPRFPYPPIGGDKLRAFNIIKFYSKKNEITVFSLYDQESEIKELPFFETFIDRVIVKKISRISSYFRSFLGIFSKLPIQTHYYYSKKAQRIINEELEKGNYDLIFVHLIRMAEYVRAKKNIVKIIDLTDAISLNYERAKRYRNGFFKWVNIVEYSRVKNYEAKIACFFDRVLVISDVDRNYIRNLSQNNDKLEVLENGVDFEYFHPKPEINYKKRIVFIGNMRTFPNQDAVIHFSKEIFPTLLENIPDLNFYIVGAFPPKRVKNLEKHPNIFVTGYIEDVREFIWTSLAAVCPIRIGAGVQNKILECMACGVPVITTRIGNEGINAKDNYEISIAEKPDDYLKILIRLINSQSYRKSIASNARAFIEQRFQWDIILSKLNDPIVKESN